MDGTAASLQAWLDKVTFTGKDQHEVTELLTAAATEWGEANGWRVYRKARSVFPLPPPYADKFSWVDVAFARAGSAPMVVEIDRSARQRTLDKLVAEAQAGRVAIWLRWGEGPFAELPTPVELVTFEVVKAGPGKYSTPVPDRPAPEHSGIDLGDADQMDLFPPPS